MKVVWTERARADLRAAFDYLHARSPQAANRIVSRILRRVADQAHTPHAAPIEREGPERCLVVAKTPYVVVYDLNDDVLRVVALYHHAQKR